MDKKEVIHKQAEELLNKLQVQFELSVDEKGDAFNLQIDSADDASLLIGRYGETLQSLQRILEGMFFTMFAEKTKIVVNVNDYRQKQKERLESIAENVAQRVREERQKQSLQSFSAYERKIIHEFISEQCQDLTSYSEGEGSARVLHVALKEET